MIIATIAQTVGIVSVYNGDRIIITIRHFNISIDDCIRRESSEDNIYTDYLPARCTVLPTPKIM